MSGPGSRRSGPAFTTGGDDVSENRRRAREQAADRMVAAGVVDDKTRDTMGTSPGGRAENLIARARNEARPLAHARLRDMPDRPRGLPTGYESAIEGGPKGEGPKTRDDTKSGYSKGGMVRPGRAGRARKL